MPLYNLNTVTEDDDLDLDGCDYVNTVDGERFPADSTYESVWYLVDDLRDPITDCFDLTQEQHDNMSFMDIYNYADITQSDIFEPVDRGCDFSEDVLNWMNETVYSTLTLPMAEPIYTRDLYVSKQLRAALNFMDRNIQAFVDGQVRNIPDLKFLSYSTHDWTVA